MEYRRMPIEQESPEELGYHTIKYNLAESSVNDLLFKDLKIDVQKTVLCYGSHQGNKKLRKLICKEYNSQKPDDVLITAGAANALFIIHTALLKKNDEIIVLHPNYATNLETPYAIGCKIKTYKLNIHNNYLLKAEELIKLISKKTKLVSLTNPHNPSGKVFDTNELEKINSYCEKQNIPVLIDETYFQIPLNNYKHQLLKHRKNIIRVSSLSKAYGVPGIRIGWIYCTNKTWMNSFLAAKEQIIICNSVIDEEIAYQILKNKKMYLNKVQLHVNKNYRILLKWLKKQEVIDYVIPQAGVVMMPRLKNHIHTQKFYQTLFEKYKTYVGPGHWFGLPENYFRLGFGWPKTKELKKGLENITKAALANI
jgi:aspartate/methionine/tyrosine aminotransferase